MCIFENFILWYIFYYKSLTIGFQSLPEGQLSITINDSAFTQFANSKIYGFDILFEVQFP